MKFTKQLIVALVATTAAVSGLTASSYWDKAKAKLQGYTEKVSDLYESGKGKVKGLYETVDTGLDKFRTGTEKLGGTIQGLHRQYSPEDIEEMTKHMTPTQKEAYLKSSGIVSKGRDLYGKIDTTARDIGRGAKKLGGKIYDSYRSKFGGKPTQKELEEQSMEEMAEYARSQGIGVDNPQD